MTEGGVSEEDTCTHAMLSCLVECGRGRDDRSSVPE